MIWHEDLHRLKLVTGVDISTRPVRRTGREGKVKKSTSLRAAAEVNRMAFRRSITMFKCLKCTQRFSGLEPEARNAPRGPLASCPIRPRVSAALIDPRDYIDDNNTPLHI